MTNDNSKSLTQRSIAVNVRHNSSQRSHRRSADRHSAAGSELVGKFFLTYQPDGAVLWQGRILSQPKPGLYLVQLFEWFLGEPSDQMLIPLEQMQGWSFYPDVETWHHATKLKTAMPLFDRHAPSPSHSEEQPKR